MHRLLTLPLALLVLSTPSQSARLVDSYGEGDRFQYSIESGGKIIGTQSGLCTGWKPEGADSLLAFSMETKSVFSRAGKTFDMDVSCVVEYLSTGLPRKYSYTLTLLSARVEHSGEFNGREYVGKTTRLGVTQPFSFSTTSWPILFDNNFALQWEIALRDLRLNVGDSLAVEAMIPQLNRALVLTLHGLANETITYDGRSISVRRCRVDPANQILYIDDAGRLLKAVDVVQGITVSRVPEGQRVQIARKSFINTFMDRVPIYGLTLAFAVGWFLIFGLRQVGRLEVILLFVLGAGLYWLSLKLLAPLQTAYFALTLDPQSPPTSIYLVLLGSALLFALVEEFTKFLPIFVLSLLRTSRSPRFGLVIGAACGAGLGMMQALNLLSFAEGASAVSSAPGLQKLFLIGVNTGTGAMIGFLVFSRLAAGYYLIPIGLKTAFDWMAAFVQKGALSAGMHAFLSFVFAVLAVGVALFFSRRSATAVAQGRSTRKKGVF